MEARERTGHHTAHACPFARRLRCTCVCCALLAASALLAGCERVDRGTRVAVHPPGPTACPDSRTTARPARAAIHTLELGRSVKGVPLTLEIFGDGPDRVLIFGGIHGSEPTSAFVAARLADCLRISWERFEGKTVAILAQANPDGLAKHSRANANGVDLNRNFPASNWRQTGRGRFYNGSAPSSEPETRAIIRAVEHVRPARIVSIHSTGRGTHCNNYDGPAEHLARSMAKHNGYPVKATMGYPTPGSFGTWAGIDRKIPTITLELPNDLSGQRCWRDNLDALHAFLDGGSPAKAGGR